MASTDPEILAWAAAERRILRFFCSTVKRIRIG